MMQDTSKENFIPFLENEIKSKQARLGEISVQIEQLVSEKQAIGRAIHNMKGTLMQFKGIAEPETKKRNYRGKEQNETSEVEGGDSIEESTEPTLVASKISKKEAVSFNDLTIKDAAFKILKQHPEGLTVKQLGINMANNGKSLGQHWENTLGAELRKNANTFLKVDDKRWVVMDSSQVYQENAHQ